MFHPHLNKDEWVIARYAPHGWFIANKTYWGKTLKDEDGKEYCSGWECYYLHQDGSIQWITGYFPTKEDAEKCLQDLLAKTCPSCQNIDNGILYCEFCDT